MRTFKNIFALTLIFVLTLSLSAIAEERQEEEKKLAHGEEDFVPTTSVFHLDIRALTVFDVKGTGLMRTESPDDEMGIGQSLSGLGSGVGVKMGYLIDGHHDVGGHLQYGNSTVVTRFEPEDERADKIETRTSLGSFRAAAYYNYNWHVKGWVMPYVGPVIGIDTDYYNFKDLDDDDSEVTRILFTPFVGVEGGVKLFPMKNVAFDLAMTTTAGPTAYVTTYGSDKDDDKFGGGSIDLAFHAGLCVYFE